MGEADGLTRCQPLSAGRELEVNSNFFECWLFNFLHGG